MSWNIHDANHKSSVLILVSKFDHCLLDLLYQTQSGVLPMAVAGIVSNHPDTEKIADFYQIPFNYLPVGVNSKLEQEQNILDLVRRLSVDLVVLARYMQILSPQLSDALSGRCINIHHSFLPSFKGAKPYHQAHLRGVKIIGATAHYVTSDLDEGPIIEQETTHVTHAHSAEDMVQIGRHLECQVLSRAVKYHLERRVLLNDQKTIVFK
jgi:formyltetrahydrofolate deformylase